MVGIDDLVTCCRVRMEIQALRGLRRLFVLDQCLQQPSPQPASGAQTIPAGGIRQLV